MLTCALRVGVLMFGSLAVPLLSPRGACRRIMQTAVEGATSSLASWLPLPIFIWPSPCPLTLLFPPPPHCSVNPQAPHRSFPPTHPVALLAPLLVLLWWFGLQAAAAAPGADLARRAQLRGAQAHAGLRHLRDRAQYHPGAYVHADGDVDVSVLRMRSCNSC